ncbi:uncharacterized protein VP01_3160g4 [Puccinia sorghi]|uniref:Uncharacterized protein n=1 Tax=Puccinia sorghi TaxID=27349 RepID=A0A0L6UYT4_9BASI|nr:uncharacterized protein VP01_3160g4 [Puccinia sorghi]
MDNSDNHDFTAGAQETKINTQSGEHVSHTLENTSMGKGSGEMILESRLAIMGSIFFLTEWIFVEDKPTVNAWWYLQAKFHMEKRRQ